MKSLNRRKFLEVGSKSAIAFFIGHSINPRIVYAANFVESLWSGAVTPDSIRVNVKIDHDSTTVRCLVSTSPTLSNPIKSGYYTADTTVNNRMVSIPITGLNPKTQYYYGIESGSALDDINQGKFRTPDSGAHSFTFAFSSCADTGSTHAVFDTIRTLNPLFFLHIGDMHYENITVNNRTSFRAAYDSVLASSTQSALYREIPISYMWDDHDFGPNDSDMTSPGRQAARLTYQEYIPHYPLAAGSGNVPIYQSFTIGRVRFVLTDLRSERTPKTAFNDANKTMMGGAQKAWFKNELLAARSRYPVIVWVSTVPWIGTLNPGVDFWAGYATERLELANFIKDNQIKGVVMLSGDAHMIALDDGTNSDYASSGGAAFPVLHAAALDRPGLPRGGPYSHGAYPGPGQFGLVTINDNGGNIITITLSGRDASNNKVLPDYSFDIPWHQIYLPILVRS